MTFKDHFSLHSDNYQQYRPNYPDKLFDYLASLTQDKTLAWDCATGTGQVASRLVRYFDHVLATDASSSQIDNAMPHDRISYQVCPAEKTPFESSSISLIAVAQALHWFDREIFFTEANRVLKPGGLLAVWSYNLLSIETEVDLIVDCLYKDTLNKYWPAERQLIEEEYSSVVLPFPEVEHHSFEMQTNWNLDQLLGYLNTWSAVKRYESATGNNPVADTSKLLLDAWGDPDTEKQITWPLSLRACIKPAAG